MKYGNEHFLWYLRNMVSRERIIAVGLMLASTVFFLLLAETSLRLASAWSSLHQLSPEEQLERTRTLGVGHEVQNARLAELITPSSHRDVVYELKPRLTGTFLRQPISTNAYGMRERDVNIDKAEGMYRIAGIGDSVMFGWGVAAEETYLRLLEEALNAQASRGRRYQALNFAVPGYNTAMEVATFEHKVLPFQPDLVVLHFVDNDFTLPAFLRPPENPWDIENSFLLDFIRRRFGNGESDFDDDLVDIQSPRPIERRTYSQYSQMVGPTGFRTALIRLAELTKPRNIPVLILIGGAGKTQRAIVERAAKKLGFSTVRVKPYVEQYVEEHNLRAERERNSDLFSISATDHHPNPIGHRIYANALLAALQQFGLGE